MGYREKDFPFQLRVLEKISSTNIEVVGIWHS